MIMGFRSETITYHQQQYSTRGHTTMDTQKLVLPVADSHIQTTSKICSPVYTYI